MAIRGTNIFTLLEDSGDEEEPKETVVKTAAPVVDLREEKKPKPAETSAKSAETSKKPVEAKAKPVEAKPKPAEEKREEVKKEAPREEEKSTPKAEIVEPKKQTKPQEVTVPEPISNPVPVPAETAPIKKAPRKKPETEEERRTQREEQWQKKREEEREAEDRARAEASRYMTYQELLRSKEQGENSDEPAAGEREAKEKTGFLLPTQVKSEHFSRGGRGSRGRGRGGFRPTNQPEKPSAAPPKFDSADFPALSS